MERRLYCIYDYKAQAPVNAIFQAFGTDAEASRMFAAVCTSPGTLVQSHPQDFGLVFVGTIDFDTLSFVPSPACIASPIIMGDACVRAVARAREVSSDSDSPQLQLQ